ncbi:hypothetical protein [Parabacteroides sp. Marseille-P3160]|uniref:hypothetical protein n=1 Tax=Parabacteroides sp. Marseille-P3160 TaxID=1917887 RepID=UPI00111B647D|nr:hypothetical protein [Parabacteroides sp. Marseille-P3160]
MKKPILSILIVIVILFFTFSCNDDDSNTIIDEKIIELKVLAIQNNDTIADATSKVFLYYKDKPLELQHFTYKGNGIFSSKDSTIVPDQSSEINFIGEANIIPLQLDKVINIIIETDVYENPYYTKIFFRPTDILKATIYFNL